MNNDEGLDSDPAFSSSGSYRNSRAAMDSGGGDSDLDPMATGGFSSSGGGAPMDLEDDPDEDPRHDRETGQNRSNHRPNHDPQPAGAIEHPWNVGKDVPIFFAELESSLTLVTMLTTLPNLTRDKVR